MIPTKIKYKNVFPIVLARGKIVEKKSLKEIKEAIRKTKLPKDSVNPTMEEARERRSEVPENP